MDRYHCDRLAPVARWISGRPWTVLDGHDQPVDATAEFAPDRWFKDTLLW